MGHKATDREIASQFERVEVIESASPGDRLSFNYTTPSVHTPERWRIWASSYNRNLPWRTAKLEKFTDRLGNEQDRFTTHAGHATLREAFEWLQKLD